MDSFDSYSWMAGSQSDFTKPFKDNEQLLKQAKSFWQSLESSGSILLLIGVITGCLLAYLYYHPFNELPGRHYHPKYWIIFMIIAVLASFGITLLFLALTSEPRLDGAFVLELKISCCNALYSLICYSLLSFVWCNWLPTNAYRLLRIK